MALSLVAAVASAHGGPGGGAPPAGLGGSGGDHGAPGGGLIVDTNGTVYVVSESTDSAGVTTETVKAITTSGTTAWTATISPSGRIELAGSNLIVVSHTHATSTTAASSTITAYSAASGAKAWSVTLDGEVGDIRAFSGGIYAVQVIPPTTTGGTATRNLVAISNSGAVLWKVSL
jgi:hypothetical protein